MPEIISPITLRPPNPRTETVAEIRIDGNKILLHLPEYMDEFRNLARGLGYQWKRPWERIINQFNGPLEDRLIEAAYKTLRAGFIVRIPDASLQERIINGEYAEEHRRWIMKRTAGRYDGWFAIQWGRDESFYERARRLRGARWSKPSVVVPSDQFEEVLDFAEVHGFRLSPGAEGLIEEARQRRAMEIRVELRPREVKNEEKVSGEPTGVIHADLRDDD